MEVITKSLGQICDEGKGTIRTGPFGSQLHRSDYCQDGIPVVMPKDIIGGRVSVEDVARVDGQHALRLSQHRLKVGDIVYGRRGDIGRHAFIQERESGCLCGTGCIRVTLGDSVLDPKFLHYYLCQENVIAWVTLQAVGATMPNLNTSILRSVPITFPPLPTQRKITAILSVYDDLIENNLRRIKILEEMSQNLYHEWFVEFHFPGYKHARFIDSPIGPIPEGWGIAKMPEAVEVRPHLHVPTSEQVIFVPMGSLSESSMLISDVEIRSKASGTRFQNGDTLFAGITPCLENGKTGFVQFLPSGDAIACGSTEFIVLRSKTLCPEYVYLMARSDAFRDNAIKSMSGASGRQRVREECFDQFLLAHPPVAIIEQFQTITRSQFDSIHCLTRRNDTLRRTRDLLLPKLITGEIDVSELDLVAPEEAKA